MTLADSVGLALAVTAVLAVAARLAGALTTGGAIAGALVGACVSLGFGLPGLAVLGTFFVVGTVATRIGWTTKKARGTAEAGEGRRDWKRVLGKGGVAAFAAIAYPLLSLQFAQGGVFVPGIWHLAFVFCAAVAAALADTLGTEIGTLSRGSPRAVPSFARVPIGTPGAVSLAGLAGAAGGAALVGGVAFAASHWTFLPGSRSAVQTEWSQFGFPLTAIACAAIATIGVAASLVESVAVGMGLRASGFIRNLLTTGSAAFLACLLWPLRGYLTE